MSSEVYIYLSSSAFQNYFPKNKAASFTALLPETLHFEDSWEVALIQIQYPPSKKSQEVLLMTDFTEDLIFHNNKRPILRKFPLNMRGKSITFNLPLYKPVKSTYVEQISLYITNEKDREPLFNSKSLSCTLHFRKRFAST